MNDLLIKESNNTPQHTAHQICNNGILTPFQTVVKFAMQSHKTPNEIQINKLLHIISRRIKLVMHEIAQIHIQKCHYYQHNYILPLIQRVYKFIQQWCNNI